MPGISAKAKTICRIVGLFTNMAFSSLPSQKTKEFRQHFNAQPKHFSMEKKTRSSFNCRVIIGQFQKRLAKIMYKHLCGNNCKNAENCACLPARKVGVTNSQYQFREHITRIKRETTGAKSLDKQQQTERRNEAPTCASTKNK